MTERPGTLDLWEMSKIYMASITGAALALLVNYSQTQELSLLVRSQFLLEGVLAVEGIAATLGIIFSILFYCLIAAFVAVIYRPNRTMDAFIIGFAVIAVINMLVPTHALQDAVSTA